MEATTPFLLQKVDLAPAQDLKSNAMIHNDSSYDSTR